MSAPTSSEAWIDEIFNAVVSDVQALAYFRKVLPYEPKRATTEGLTAAVWVQSMQPVGMLSGMSSTSGLLVFLVRIYSNMLQEPQDHIDPNMLRAASALMRRYHDDFDFDLHPLVRNVDLLGMSGTSLGCVAGYLEVDRKMYRIYDITVPVIVNDMWTQS
jgi:hypothetical protein